MVMEVYPLHADITVSYITETATVFEKRGKVVQTNNILLLDILGYPLCADKTMLCFLSVVALFSFIVLMQTLQAISFTYPATLWRNKEKTITHHNLTKAAQFADEIPIPLQFWSNN